MLSSYCVLVAVGAVVVCVLASLKGRRRSVGGFHLPPGPPPLPFIGNILSIDPKKPWITYTDWRACYGDIFMIRVLKQDIIVINSEKIAKDLFERRSRVYSDRPYLATRVPYGWAFNFGFIPYGDRWRSQRRIFHQAFRAEASLAFHPVQLKKARQLVLDLLSSPHVFHDHVQRYSAAVIMSIVYDYDVASHHDPLVEIFERGNVLAMESLTPETACVIEAFPFVLNLPEWFPGGVFRRKAAISRSCAMEMIEEPFKYARQRETTSTGSSASAVALDLLKRTKNINDPLELQLIKDTCATAFVAGAETTATALKCFMLAMVQYPEAQARAQAEIDAVVGRTRPPSFDDRPNLPYIEAVMMETLRVYSINPLGLAHAATIDDTYEGFYFPKGCTVVTNVWAMQHDEAIYQEPYVFKPERFLVDGNLKEGLKFVNTLVFGYGRRACPGRHTADASIWVAVVLILWAFNLRKARNEKGEEIDFEPTFTHGVTRAPYPFPCSITQRPLNKDIRELLSS